MYKDRKKKDWTTKIHASWLNFQSWPWTVRTVQHKKTNSLRNQTSQRSVFQAVSVTGCNIVGSSSYKGLAQIKVGLSPNQVTFYLCVCFLSVFVQRMGLQGGRTCLSLVYCCVPKSSEEDVTNKEQSGPEGKRQGPGVASVPVIPALRRLRQEDCPHWINPPITAQQARRACENQSQLGVHSNTLSLKDRRARESTQCVLLLQLPAPGQEAQSCLEVHLQETQCPLLGSSGPCTCACAHRKTHKHIIKKKKHFL